MLVESLLTFVADQGVSATWYGAPWAVDRSGISLDSSKFGAAGLQTVTAPVLFDQPDTDVLSKRVQTTGYKMTFIASQFPGIKRDDAVVINDANYSVLTASSLDDGAFFEAALQLVVLPI